MSGGKVHYAEKVQFVLELPPLNSVHQQLHLLTHTIQHLGIAHVSGPGYLEDEAIEPHPPPSSCLQHVYGRPNTSIGQQAALSSSIPRTPLQSSHFFNIIGKKRDVGKMS